MKAVTDLFSLVMIALSIMVYSCKKDDVSESALEGKWTFVKVHERSVVNHEEAANSTTNLPSSAFIEFKAGGAFVSHLDDLYAGFWVRHGDKLYLEGAEVFDLTDDGYDIQKLTGSELQLYGRGTPRDGDLEEITFYLKK